MEISRLLLCSLFILHLYGCTTGAKKKKDLETIVEVSLFYESYIFSCSFHENRLNHNLICSRILIAIPARWHVYFTYLLLSRLRHIHRLFVNHFIWDKARGLLSCSNLSNVLLCVIPARNSTLPNSWPPLIRHVPSFKQRKGIL